MCLHIDIGALAGDVTAACALRSANERWETLGSEALERSQRDISVHRTRRGPTYHTAPSQMQES